MARRHLGGSPSFCVATAERHAATLYTGDPEIIALAGSVAVLDLRAA